MSQAEVRAILVQLTEVSAIRRRVAGAEGLRRCVCAVKAFQHARFAATYADLLADPDYAAAAKFFLDELYGPKDFSERDAQFARIVPALVRLFPREVVATVRSLAELHALSEQLDVAMATVLESHNDLSGQRYCTAWQRVGQIQDRERQIGLMLDVGGALIRYTRHPMLRHSLRLMRQPARASGLGVLQNFLETGFDTFSGLPDARAFLALVSARERRLSDQLFAWDGRTPLPSEIASMTVEI